MDWAALAVLALVLLALAGRFAWWVATEEDFGLVAGVLWAIAFVIAYFVTAGDLYIARMPAGFLVFAGVSAAALPLTWAAASSIALVVVIAAQLAFSLAAGSALSGRLRSRVLSRYPEGGEPPWLNQREDVIADFGTWALLALGAVIFLWVAPLLVLAVVSSVVDVPLQQAKWICAAWGFVAMAGFAAWMGAARWLWLPLGAWIFLAVTAAMLAADLLAGPFVEKSGLQVAVIVLPGALLAAFVEVFILGGGGRKGPKASIEGEGR